MNEIKKACWAGVAQVQGCRPLKDQGDLQILDLRMTFADRVIAQGREDYRKPWERDEFLTRASQRARKHLLACNPRTVAGLFNAQRWADVIVRLQEEMDSYDADLRNLKSALTATFSRRQKAYTGGDLTVPARKNAKGQVVSWKTVLQVHPRLETDATAVPGRTADGRRYVVSVWPSNRPIGNAELGLAEPQFRIGDGELPDDGPSVWDVVSEEKVRRNFTYSEEAESQWRDRLLGKLAAARTPRDLLNLYSEVERAWGAKAFRYHVYREVHDEVVEFARGIPRLLNHPVIKGWSKLSDAGLPPTPEALRDRVKTLSAQVSAAREAGNEELVARLSLERKSTYRMLFAAETKAAFWRWENFLASEGLGAGEDGQPFGDGSEDALAQKNARATAGSAEEVDTLFYGGDGDGDGDGDEVSRPAQESWEESDDDLPFDSEDASEDDLRAFAVAHFAGSRGASVAMLSPWKGREFARNLPVPRQTPLRRVEKFSLSEGAREMLVDLSERELYILSLRVRRSS
jgi:hypothetical protein